jgi:hypothetical protein
MTSDQYMSIEDWTSSYTLWQKLKPTENPRQQECPRREFMPSIKGAMAVIHAVNNKRNYWSGLRSSLILYLSIHEQYSDQSILNVNQTSRIRY